MSNAYRLVSADEFLQLDFGPDRRAELDKGVIRMMAGGTAAHARVQTNLLSYLRMKLRGTPCRPFGSDMALRVSEQSVRYPDLAVYCDGPGEAHNDAKKALSSPRVVFEILSPNTASFDQGQKLAEYQEIGAVEAIVFVDPEAETIRLITRLGPQSFRDDRFGTDGDLELPCLGLTVPRGEVFARD